jgi:membrane associated rhomboid family serine protease
MLLRQAAMTERAYTSVSGRALRAVFNPVHLIMGTCIGASGAYLLHGAGQQRWRRWYNDHMLLSNARFQRRPYTLFTSLFMHANWVHLAANMFTLYTFGNASLAMLGPVRWLALYFGAGAAGGLAQLSYNAVVPSSSLPAAARVRWDNVCVGASSAIAGCTMYYAAVFPHSETILLVLPVKNWLFVPLFVGFSAWAAVSGGESTWAHAAHLGGAGVGLLAAGVTRMRMRRFR